MKKQASLVFFILTTLSPTLIQGQDTATASALTEAAGKGDAEAEFQLARVFLYGKGVPKAPAKAYELMSSAASKSHPEAIGGMGYLYLNGVGVEKDPTEALVWFRKGAELGSAKAQLNLARCLLGREKTAGIPRPTDPEERERATSEALDWLAKAAGQGQVEAAISLGRFHYFGEQGLKADMSAAEPWLLIAAEAGDAVSQNLLGVIHDPKIPRSKKDPDAARKWYEMAAMRGNLKAQGNLGRLIDPFSGDPDTRAEALAWILIAKADGDVTSQKFFEENKQAFAPADLQAANERVIIIRNSMRDQLLRQ